MKLNLVLIRDYLSDTEFLDADCQSHALRFERPICYEGGPMMRNSLYVCEASALPEVPPFFKSDHISVIVRGALPETWKGQCEYLSVSPETLFSDLFNRIMSVFLYFQKWELSLNALIRSGASLHAIGKALFDVVGNPVDFVTNFFKEVLLVIDPKKPQPEYFSDFYKEGEFLQEDELQIVFADEEYQKSLRTRGPSMFSSALYGYRMLYQNLFVEGAYIGRLVISERYRAIRESDYSLLSFFSGYFLEVYVRTQNQNLGLPGQLEKLVEALLSGENYLPEYDELLAGRNWKKDDAFQCLVFRPPQGRMAVSMVNSAVYLAQQFPLCLTYSLRDELMLILNETHTREQSGFFSKVEQFCKGSGFSAGVSLSFVGFDQLRLHSRQAEFALRFGQKIFASRNIYYYNEFILEQMLDTLKSRASSENFVSQSVRRLIRYDSEHNAELCETLRVSLQNQMNSMRSAKNLSLSRTAYLYRMQRIKDITGYDLGDYRTRLYLMLLFEIGVDGLKSE